MIATTTEEKTMALNAIKTLPRTHWKQSYTGKARRCCCGCAGNYSSNTRAVSSQINRIIRLIETAEEESLMVGFPFAKRELPVEQQVMTEIEWISVERNGRMYTVYNWE